MDIGTGGEVGFRVIAAADAKIVRVKSERRGYGKVLYLQHENGYMTVYAHLDDFAPILRARIPDARFFDVFLSPPIPVKQGDTIAFTGETGAGLPHLHFEVRRGYSRPVEPFSAGLEPVKDAPPLPDFLTLFPATSDSRINGSPYPLVLTFEEASSPPADTADSSREARYVLTRAPQVTGSVYLELTAHEPGATPTSRRGIFGWKLADRSASPSRFCSARSIETFDYGAPEGLVNRIFNPVRSHIGPTFFTYRLYPIGQPSTPECDAPEFTADGKSHLLTLQLFTESGLEADAALQFDPPGGEATGAGKNGENEPPPGNPGLSYPWNPGDTPGIHVSLLHDHLLVTALSDDSSSVLRIARDSSTILESDPGKLAVESIPTPAPGPLHFVLSNASGGPTSDFVTQLYTAKPDQPLEAEWGNVGLQAAAGAFLRETPVMWTPADLPEYSRLPFVTPPFRIEPLGEPLREPATLRLSSPDYAPDTGIYHWDAFVHGWRYIGSVFSESTAPAAPLAPGEADPPPPKFLTTTVLHFDTYAVLKDQIPPVIYPPTVFRKRMVIPITDLGMGVDDGRVVVTLNGKPVAGDYDPDRAWFLTDLPYSRFVGKGRTKVVAYDRGGNRSQKSFSLRSIAP